MRGRCGRRNFLRFADSAIGRTILRESRNLFAVLTNHDGLRRLPSGSLGRAYLEFMDAERLSARSLLEASQDWENDLVPPNVDFFRAPMRELHDVSRARLQVMGATL
jgi:ubiquinone biosynthesis protein COQ4